MKKFVFMMLLLVAGLTASAQQTRSIEAGYELGSDWAGFKASYVHEYVWASVEFGGVAKWSDLYDKDDTDSFMFKISAGGAYKYWFADKFYVEGRAGLGYWSTKYQKYDSDGDVYLTLQPRIGWQFATHWGVFAGGQFDFYKLKFKEGYNQGYGTVGVAYHF